MQMEIERQALQKEKDKASKERLAKIERSLADLRERSANLKTRWETEKEAIAGLRAVKEKIEQIHLEIEQAERRADLEHAARLRYGELPSLEKKRAGAEQQIQQIQKEGALDKEEVDRKIAGFIVGPAFPVSKLWRRNANFCTWKTPQPARWGRTKPQAVSKVRRRARAGYRIQTFASAFYLLWATGGEDERGARLANFCSMTEGMIRKRYGEYQEQKHLSRAGSPPPG